MNSGDIVTLVAIPPNIREDEELETRALIEKCLGRSFVIAGIESFEGVPFPLVRIDVGHMIG